MPTLGQFANRTVRIAQRVRVNSDALVKQTTEKVVETLGRRTPIDTGQAISNWQVSIDAPLPNSAFFIGPVGQKGNRNSNVVLVKRFARDEVAGYRGETNRAVWITNVAPYIGKLNNGWSKQAPAGFVRLAVDEGIHAIRLRSILR